MGVCVSMHVSVCVIVCVCVYACALICLCVYTLHVCLEGFCRPMNSELYVVVSNLLIGAGNRTRVLYKNSKCLHASQICFFNRHSETVITVM